MGPNYMGKGQGRDKLKVSTTGVVRLSHSQSSSEILQYTMVLFSTRGHRDSDSDTFEPTSCSGGKEKLINVIQASSSTSMKNGES